jgi:hypothetical protein
LLVISSNAAQGISSPATFSVIVSLGAEKALHSLIVEALTHL